ncbi:formylglycine-generating enzyme family protein [Pseudoalteromonas sp. OANN1]|uniref:formylglycine-generating enzyme family protein n=1 Tax=Pseudoalteromonas sp. OANN1 TaxID=2954497 RepID=UPI0020978A40|nr:formylglycine-generating enzyme family protein [Pseudoalteromonas sp. OANN1]MCO7200688.1 formylglycine-generating enzyme family protein [Pseudoalteromonas sp. OANN1]
MVSSKAEHLIKLCDTYCSYLESNGLKMKRELCDALNAYGMVHHQKALKAYFEAGTNISLEVDLLGGGVCYVSEIPPSSAEAGELWFDPYELVFMVKTTNPLGFGKGVIGWLSIHPVFYWQYHVFQRLVKYTVRDDSFLQVDDILTSRPFGIDKSDYATDIYSEEAKAYAKWHGKWLASNIRIEALLQSWNYQSNPEIFDTGIYYWDNSFGGDESERLVFGFSDKNSLNQGQVAEWFRGDNIGIVTAIVDQVGLTNIEHLPKDSGECLTLINCAKKVNL